MTALRASHVVVTTPRTKEIYATRYSNEDANKWKVIRNGYDEENFRNARALARPDKSAAVRLMHSGLLYPSERDPSHFFEALSQLHAEGVLDASRLQVTLRATGHDEHHSTLIEKYNVGEFVKLKPGIAYAKALAEMLSVDGLLIFQAANCNHQIPAKLYEYFRAGRPILALTDPAGDTAKTMYDAELSDVARLDSTEDIKTGLMRFVRAIENRTAATVSEAAVTRYSRRNQAADLATLFDQTLTAL